MINCMDTSLSIIVFDMSLFSMVDTMRRTINQIFPVFLLMLEYISEVLDTVARLNKAPKTLH